MFERFKISRSQIKHFKGMLYNVGSGFKAIKF